MIADIDEHGNVVLYPTTSMEVYALKKWDEDVRLLGLPSFPFVIDYGRYGNSMLIQGAAQGQCNVQSMPGKGLKTSLDSALPGVNKVPW